MKSVLLQSLRTVINGDEGSGGIRDEVGKATTYNNMRRRCDGTYTTAVTIQRNMERLYCRAKLQLSSGLALRSGQSWL